MNIKKNLKFSKGFTLVELLVYMSLLAILLVILSQIFTAILEIKLESEATFPLQQDSRSIIARLNYDINRATSIATPQDPGNSSSILNLDINGETYSYQLNSNNLELINNFGTNNINGSQTSVTNLNFQRLGKSGENNSIKVQFTIESQTQRPTGLVSKSFTTTIGSR